MDLPCRRNCIRGVSSSIGTSHALATSVVAAPFTPPSSLDVRAHVYDDMRRAPLQIFFASSGDTRSADARMRHATLCERSYALSHSIGSRNDNARSSGRRVLPNGDRCARNSGAARPNQNVSQSSPPAVAAAGADATDAPAGLRTGAARLGAASRSSRAAAGAGELTATAAGAGTVRGA